jgi:hypothetical protein
MRWGRIAEVANWKRQDSGQGLAVSEFLWERGEQTNRLRMPDALSALRLPTTTRWSKTTVPGYQTSRCGTCRGTVRIGTAASVGCSAPLAVGLFGT